MPLSQPFKVVKTRNETRKIGLRDIHTLRKLLEAKHRKDLSVLLEDCSSYLEESSQYGSYLFSVISTFWIYVPPEKIEKAEQLSQRDQELLLKLARKIYPPKDYSPEIKEVKFRVLVEDIENQKKQNNSKETGQLPGVFIAARKIRNEGEILSEGPEARTEILTEDYKGSGVVKSEITESKSKEKWYQKWWGQIIIGIIIVVIGSIIVKIIS